MQLLRPGEVRRHYKLSTTTLRQLEHTGDLTPVRTKGGHRRFRVEDLDAIFVRWRGERAKEGT